MGLISINYLIDENLLIEYYILGDEWNFYLK